MTCAGRLPYLAGVAQIIALLDSVNAPFDHVFVVRRKGATRDPAAEAQDRPQDSTARPARARHLAARTPAAANDRSPLLRAPVRVTSWQSEGGLVRTDGDPPRTAEYSAYYGDDADDDVEGLTRTRPRTCDVTCGLQ